MEINGLVQMAVLGVSTGFGSAVGAELGKALVRKALKHARR